MAPPFSPGEEGDGSLRRRSRKDRISGPSLMADTLTKDPQLVDKILDDKGGKRNKTKKKKQENKTEKKPRINRYEKPRKINKVTLEIPVLLESETDKDSMSSPRVKLSQNARCSISCHVPPSKPNGRWTGSISGNTTVLKSIGSTNGSLDLSCKVSPSCRLTGGMTMVAKANTRPLQAHIGAQFVQSNQDVVQITARQQGNNGVGITLLAKEVSDPWIQTTSTTFNTKTRDFGLLFSATSMTTHVLRLGLGMTRATMLQPRKFLGFLPLSSIQFSLDPKLASNRRAPISVVYHPITRTWQGSFGFQTSRVKDKDSKTSIPSSWRIGIQQGKTTKSGKSKQTPAAIHPSNWSITVTWQHGDFTLRIPILIGSLVGMVQTNKDANATTSLVATATPYLVLAIVGVANEIVSQLLWGTTSTKSSTTTTPSLSPSNAMATVKAKEDAAAQQRLMERTAASKKSAEQAKDNGGLVVESAIYQYGEEVSWDVTIPLQFWVEGSSLYLAAGSKANLLGFYPLPNNKHKTPTKDTSATGALETQKQSNVAWWQEYWIPTKDRQKSGKEAATKPNNQPTLVVEYSYKGQSYEVSVGDDEELRLPGKAESNTS